MTGRMCQENRVRLVVVWVCLGCLQFFAMLGSFAEVPPRAEVLRPLASQSSQMCFPLEKSVLLGTKEQTEKIIRRWRTCMLAFDFRLIGIERDSDVLKEHSVKTSQLITKVDRLSSLAKEQVQKATQVSAEIMRKVEERTQTIQQVIQTVKQGAFDGQTTAKRMREEAIVVLRDAKVLRGVLRGLQDHAQKQKKKTTHILQLIKTIEEYQRKNDLAERAKKEEKQLSNKKRKAQQKETKKAHGQERIQQDRHTKGRKSGEPMVVFDYSVVLGGRWISSGSFLMGSPASEVGRDSDEGPQRSVRISRGFWMMESEVTQGLYKAVMGSNPSHFSSCGERCPVEQVSWHDAALFANKVSENLDLPKCFVCHGEGKALRCEGVGNKGSDYIECKGWRLPTEAEWEYAARAGTTTVYHTGDCISTGQANYNGNDPNTNCGRGEYRRKTIAVCSLARNAWGLCDMHGNVWEWVYDAYSNEAYKKAGDIDPVHFDGRLRSVARGGGWVNYTSYLRVAYREYMESNLVKAYTGFRLVRR